MGEGVLDEVEVTDEVVGGDELLVAGEVELELDEAVDRELDDDCVDTVDRAEEAKAEELINVEEDVDPKIVEVTEVLDDIDDMRLDVLEDERDDTEDSLTDDGDVDDSGIETDEDAAVESTAQTLILQCPPQVWLWFPPHLAEQSVSGTRALLEAEFNSFEQ